jgi:hypothetical protein
VKLLLLLLTTTTTTTTTQTNKKNTTAAVATTKAICLVSERCYLLLITEPVSRVKPVGEPGYFVAS